MELTRVIFGEVVTEKAERLKREKVALLSVHPDASKVDVKNALRRFFGVEPLAVRMVRVRSKRRIVGRGRAIQKRSASKRAYVTLSSKSKALDLTSFKT